MGKHFAFAFGHKAVEFLVGFGDVVMDEQATDFILLGETVVATEWDGDFIADASAVEDDASKLFDF